MPLILDHPDLTNELEAHFRALGVVSVAGYKLWCRRNGFGMSLSKTPAQIDREARAAAPPVEIIDPDLSPYHGPKRATYLARVLEGELDDEKLTDIPFRIRAAHLQLADDPVAQKAYRRLILHAERYADLLKPTQARYNEPHTVCNTFIAAMGQLARFHEEWLRPPDEWRSDSPRPYLQFNSLSRHLLANYDVPIFLDVCFFLGNTPRAKREQDWWMHIARGGNIRKAPGIGMTVSKRTAHLFTNGGSHWMMPIQVLRYSQSMALGGNEKLAREIASGHIGETLDHTDFWTSVIHLFINNPMLARSQVNPIVDYIRTQKFVPTRVRLANRTEVEGPPVQPTFSVKHRSIVRLLVRVDEWHQDLSHLDGLVDETWEPCGIGDYELGEQDEETGESFFWRVEELRSRIALSKEGGAMHHCVSTYDRECKSGQSSVWSIRLAVDDGPLRPILTIAVQNKRRQVTHARGKYNLKPNSRAANSKQNQLERPYIHALGKSGHVLSAWARQEGLRISHGVL